MKVRNFTLLFGGQMISVIGDALYLMVLPWPVLTTGGSAEVLGIVLAAYGIPRAVSMLLGGCLSDRAAAHLGRSWSRRVHADGWRRREHRQCRPVHCGPTGYPTPPDGARHGSAALRLIRGLSALGRPGRGALHSPGSGELLPVQRTPAGPGDAVWHDATSVARHLISILNAMQQLEARIALRMLLNGTTFSREAQV